MNLHCLLWIGVGFTSLANATSFYIRPLPEFARDARHIVRGTLHSISSEYGSDPSGLKTLYTYARLEVREVLKGPLSESEILIRKAGGTKDGVTLSIESSPEFRENEDTVLFLSEQKEDRAYEVEGLELGKFALQERNGEVFLKGGILAYSQARPQNDSEASGPGIMANQREWSLRDLRKTLGALPPEDPRLTPSRVPAPPSTPSLPAAGEIETPAPATAAPPADASPPPHDPAKLAGLLLVGAGLLFGALFLYLRRK